MKRGRKKQYQARLYISSNMLMKLLEQGGYQSRTANG